MASRSPSSMSRASSAVSRKLLATAALPLVAWVEAAATVAAAEESAALDDIPLLGMGGAPTGLTCRTRVWPVRGNMRVTVPWRGPQAKRAAWDASAEDAYVTDTIAVW